MFIIQQWVTHIPSICLFSARPTPHRHSLKRALMYPGTMPGIEFTDRHPYSQILKVELGRQTYNQVAELPCDSYAVKIYIISAT